MLSNIFFFNKPMRGEESREQSDNQYDYACQEKHLSIHIKKTIYKYREIGNKREINIFYEKRKEQCS